MKTMQPVTVAVPATSANLGPGFDCLGLALGLYNEVTFRPARGDGPVQVCVEGEGAERVPANARNLVLRAATHLFEQVDFRPAPYHLHQINAIPVGSGMGSSAAAIVGGLLAANAWSGEQLSKAELADLATALDGHPDNVAAALYGGLALAVLEGSALRVYALAVADLTAVLVLPAFTLSTRQARRALPRRVTREDAVHNVAHTALLLSGLADGDAARIAAGMRDRLHEPHRLPLIPGAAAAAQAGRDAGATAVALSGAGPALIALLPAGTAAERATAVSAAMRAALSAAGVDGRSWILPIDRGGARVV